MDTSELLEHLDELIAQTATDRGRLAEAVIALDGEIAKLRGEHEAITRLTVRFAYESVSVPSVQSGDVENARPKGINVSWPSGPGYTKPIKAKKIKAWARYKLASADWYLSTLREVTIRCDGLQRVLGVEMAVDGAVQSLCAVFEAAIFALTSTVERVAEVPKYRRTPVYSASWSKLATEAKFFNVDLVSSLSISDALIGEHTEIPQGWLAQLFVLRSRSSRQDLLLDQTDEKTEERGLSIDVPGRGPQPLLDYLSATRDQVEELLETMLCDIDDAKNRRHYKGVADQQQTRSVQGTVDVDALKRPSSV